MPAQGTQTIGEVPEQRLDPRNSTSLAVGLPRLLSAAKMDERLTTGLIGRQSRADPIFSVHGDMAFEFRVEVVATSPSAHKSDP